MPPFFADDILIFFSQFEIRYPSSAVSSSRHLHPPTDQEGECDVVGICRALCLQPDLPSKLLDRQTVKQTCFKPNKLCKAFVVKNGFARVSVW